MLVGCSDPEAAPSIPTIAVTSTAYVTVPARSTTSTVAASADDDGGGGGGGSREPDGTAADDPSVERNHEIVAGDTMSRIARRYDVEMEHIPVYNGWTDGVGHNLIPGQLVRIPPADWSPETAPDGDASAGSGGPESSESPGGCADGAETEAYEIQRGDTPGRVAAEFDITVAELDAANEDTRFYEGFVVGIEIKIPC